MPRIAILILFFLLPGYLLATPYFSAPGFQQQLPQQQSQPQPQPGVVLREGINKLLAFLEGSGAREQDKLQRFVERELAPF